MTARPWIAALLGLTTVAGGHFYNRRPYKAVFFLSLVMLLPWTAHLVAFMPTPSVSGADILAYVQHRAWILLGVYCGLAIASAATSFFDAYGKEQAEGRGLRVVAVLTASLTGLVYIAWALYSNYSVVSTPSSLSSFAQEPDANRGVFQSGSTEQDRDFCLSQGCFGVEPDRKLASGDARISGRLRVGSRSVDGAEITLLMLDGAVTETVVTDENGGFSISLPAGSYDVIRANVKASLPDGLWNYTLTTGREGSLEGQPESLASGYLPSQPVRFDLELGEIGALDLTLHRGPAFRQPAFLGKENMSADKLILDWTSVSGAASYGVVISRIERKGGGVTSHHPIQHLVSEDNAVSLESVVEPADLSESVPEYSIEIQAFDADGKFMAESRGFGKEFRLPQGWKIRERCSHRFTCR